jgi:hypothetical protein
LPRRLPLLAVAGVGLLAGGCGGPSEGDAEQVAEEYWIAAGQDDPSCTALVASEDLCEGDAPSSPSESAEAESAQAEDETAEVVIEDSDGDRSQVVLAVEGDTWKVTGWGAAPTPAPPEETTVADPAVAEEQITEVVIAYGASEGAEGCEFLSAQALVGLGGAEGCSREFQDIPSAELTVDAVTVTGDTAEVEATNVAESGTTFDISLVLENGEWKISELPGLRE